jgi:hypothetical protein
MRNRIHRLRRGLALATVVSAIAAPVASAALVDPPIPGAPSGNSQGQQSPPDNVTAYPGTVTALSPPEPTSSPAPSPSGGTVAGDGFDWGDAGIGATAMLALAAIAAGAAVVVGHRPRRGHTVA